MHLTPEQIDRQPFRMTRRGYDIVQVRDFLREVASEMRERKHVRDRLADDGDGETAAVEKAKTIIKDAQGSAARIIADAEAEAEAVASGAEERAGSAEALEQSQQRAAQIVADAEAEAEAVAAGAEERARQRTKVVVGEAQARLDRLLAEEKEVRDRLENQRTEAAPIASAASIDLATRSDDAESFVDSRDRGSSAQPDTSLADFMKATLRQEVTPD